MDTGLVLMAGGVREPVRGDAGAVRRHGVHRRGWRLRRHLGHHHLRDARTTALPASRQDRPTALHQSLSRTHTRGDT